MGRIRDPWSTTARVTAIAGMAVAVALVVGAVAVTDERRTLVVAVGLLSIVVLGAGIAARYALLVWTAAIGIGTIGTMADVGAAPLYAVGLFLVVEATLSSIEDRFVRTADRTVPRQRAVLVGAIAGASLVVGATLRLVARDGGGGQSEYTLVAAACIVALLVLIVDRARRERRSTIRTRVSRADGPSVNQP